MLRLDGLVAGRGDLALAGPLDLTLRAGEALLVTGENGAGKSTLLRTLAGFLPPLAGAARVEGARAPDGEAATRPDEVAGYLGHRNGLKAGLGLAANLDFWRRLDGAGPDEAAVEAALEALGLAGLGSLRAGHLSAGQARRAALARLLVAPRPLWILDEPTAALDAGSEARFAALCARHLAAGGLLVAATHRPLGLADAATLRLTRRAERFEPEEAW